MLEEAALRVATFATESGHELSIADCTDLDLLETRLLAYADMLRDLSADFLEAEVRRSDATIAATVGRLPRFAAKQQP